MTSRIKASPLDASISGSCPAPGARGEPEKFKDPRANPKTNNVPVKPDRQSIPKIYTLAEIEKVISNKEFATELIQKIEDAFVAYSEGKFNSCPIQTMGAPPMAPFPTEDPDTYAAQVCVKSGYITGSEHFIVKVASGGSPFPSSGLQQIYSQKTGKMEALLLDEGVLTELRTAAAGAVAAKLLAPYKIGCIGILGTGVQARYQLDYLRHVTDCKMVMVYGRDKKKAKQLSTEINMWQGWEATVTSSADWLLELCDLVVTTTSSREAILGVNRIPAKRNAMHINCIGADAEGKMELSTELIQRADLLVADSRRQTQERGEFATAIASKLLSPENIMEIGELVGRTDVHRTQNYDNRLTIFDSSGVAIQDAVVADMVYAKLLQSGANEMECD